MLLFSFNELKDLRRVDTVSHHTKYNSRASNTNIQHYLSSHLVLSNRMTTAPSLTSLVSCARRRGLIRNHNLRDDDLAPSFASFEGSLILASAIALNEKQRLEGKSITIPFRIRSDIPKEVE